MFPRKKRNRTGTISVVVVDKSRGGFNRIKDEVLRHLVISRVCQPLSKSATADYLKSYFHEDVSLDQIYRYMDKLYNKQRELVQQNKLWCNIA